MWLSLWEPLVSSSPPLLAHTASSVSRMRLCDLPWSEFVRNKAFWAIMCAHATFGIGYNMGIAWLPTYYNQASVFVPGCQRITTRQVCLWR